MKAPPLPRNKPDWHGRARRGTMAELPALLADMQRLAALCPTATLRVNQKTTWSDTAPALSVLRARVGFEFVYLDYVG